jgi:hypothetical protein
MSRSSRDIRSRGQLALDEIPGIVGSFREAATRRARCRLRRRRDPRGAWLPPARVLLAAVNNAERRLRRRPFDRRIRLCLEVVEAVRAVWPERLPLFVRISSVDWKEGGWDLDQAVGLAKRFASAASIWSTARRRRSPRSADHAPGPGYQVPFAERIRRDAGSRDRRGGLDHRGAAGRRHHPHAASRCRPASRRELLRDPYWPLHAADTLGQNTPGRRSICERRIGRRSRGNVGGA